MLDYNEIRLNLQNTITVDKLKNIYTTIDREALQTIENIMKVNCSQQKHKSD